MCLQRLRLWWINTCEEKWHCLERFSAGKAKRIWGRAAGCRGRFSNSARPRRQQPHRAMLEPVFIYHLYCSSRLCPRLAYLHASATALRGLEPDMGSSHTSPYSSTQRLNPASTPNLTGGGCTCRCARPPPLPSFDLVPRPCIPIYLRKYSARHLNTVLSRRWSRLVLHGSCTLLCFCLVRDDDAANAFTILSVIRFIFTPTLCSAQVGTLRYAQLQCLHIITSMRKRVKVDKPGNGSGTAEYFVRLWLHS